MTSISSSSPFVIQTISASLAALAAQKRRPDPATPSGAGAAALHAQPVDIARTVMSARRKAESAVAQDTQDLANAITAAFQAIIAQRPDLADAIFDFIGGKDGIAVTSSALKDEDRTWLEKQLNANSVLVDLVNRFNGDLGEAVDEAAAIDARKAGNPTPPKTPIGKIDHAVPLLALMQGVVSQAAPAASSNDITYTDGWHQPVDLRKATTNSLAGMIDAKRQLDALQDGSIVTHRGDGRVFYGSYVDANPYAGAASIAMAFVAVALSTSSQSAMVRALTGQLDRQV